MCDSGNTGSLRAPVLLAQKQSAAAENYLVTRRSVALRFRYISTLPASSVTVPYTQVFVPNSAGPAFAHPSGHMAYAQSPHVACIRSSWASTAPSVSPVSFQTAGFAQGIAVLGERSLERARARS